MQRPILVKSLETSEEYIVIDKIDDKANVYYVLASKKDGGIHKIISSQLCNLFRFMSFWHEDKNIVVNTGIREGLIK